MVAVAPLVSGYRDSEGGHGLQPGGLKPRRDKDKRTVSQARNLYARHVDINVCYELSDTYDKAMCYLFKLSLALTKFSQRNRTTIDETSGATLAQTWYTKIR